MREGKPKRYPQVREDGYEQGEPPKTPPQGFRLTVHQWLLYLLAEDDPVIVVYGAKILARLLVTQGWGYTAKFASKTGGFWIMAHRLKHWWDIPTIWPICFCILFGRDVADIDFEGSFDFASLISIFGKSSAAYPDALHVITALLQHGLRDVLKFQDHPDSPATDHVDKFPSISEAVDARSRAKSMSLTDELVSRSG